MLSRANTRSHLTPARDKSANSASVRTTRGTIPHVRSSEAKASVLAGVTSNTMTLAPMNVRRRSMLGLRAPNNEGEGDAAKEIIDGAGEANVKGRRGGSGDFTKFKPALDTAMTVEASLPLPGSGVLRC